jgi:hypothetical protein
MKVFTQHRKVMDAWQDHHILWTILLVWLLIYL